MSSIRVRSTVSGLEYLARPEAEEWVLEAPGRVPQKVPSWIFRESFEVILVQDEKPKPQEKRFCPLDGELLPRENEKHKVGQRKKGTTPDSS